MNLSQDKPILLIEDDPHTAELVAVYLKQEGFAPLKAGDGEEGLDMAARHRPVLIILDLLIPKIDGWEVCRRLRRELDVPIIILTARGEEVDRISGLTMGADDYVVKPFSPRELVARVQAVLRRTADRERDQQSVVSYGDLSLDRRKRRVSLEGKPLNLTPHEYVLLDTLMGSPGRIFNRDELLSRLYPREEAAVIDRVVDVHIGKLRQKIEPDPSRPRYIFTARGIGYYFADYPQDGPESHP